MGSAWEDRHKYSRAQRRDDDALIEAWHSPRRSREIGMEFGIKLPQLMALWGELKQEGRLPDIPRDRRSRPPVGGWAYEPYEETHHPRGPLTSLLDERLLRRLCLNYGPDCDPLLERLREEHRERDPDAR